MDSITANKLEYILSGYQVSSEDFNEIIDLMDTYKEQESKAKNLPISDVSKSYSGEDKLPHELAFEMENRYLNAPIIKITNHDSGNINHVNLYDLIDGMSNPIENGIQWAELWFSFKGKQLEFEAIDNKKAS